MSLGARGMAQWVRLVSAVLAMRTSHLHEKLGLQIWMWSPACSRLHTTHTTAHEMSVMPIRGDFPMNSAELCVLLLNPISSFLFVACVCCARAHVWKLKLLSGVFLSCPPP